MNKKRLIVFVLIALAVAGVILVTVVNNMTVWADLDYYGGIVYRIEEVDGKPAYCFYTVEKAFTGTKTSYGDYLFVDFENNLGYVKYYVSLSHKLTDKQKLTKGPIDILTVGLDGKHHTTADWNESDSGGYETEHGTVILEWRIGEIIYVDPDGSEKTVWKLDSLK